MALWQKTLAPSDEHKGGVGSFLKIPRSNSEAWPDDVQRLTIALHLHFFVELFPFEIFSIEIVSAL